MKATQHKQSNKTQVLSNSRNSPKVAYFGDGEPRPSVCNVCCCFFLPLFPSDFTHQNARKCQSLPPGPLCKNSCNRQGYLFGNCNPKGCTLCFKFYNVISEAHAFICPVLAMKQNVEFSTVLYMVIMKLQRAKFCT